MSLDLEEHLVFYGAYHHNAVNIAVHMACVPMILFSAFCLATNTGPLIPLPSWLTIPYLEPNLGTLAALTYGGLYVLLEPVAGSALGIICLAVTASLNCVRMSHPAMVNGASIAVHILSWVAQFIGHGVYEGRAPALLDNLVQALFLAPLFVWLELLFKLGYRPELRARVSKAIEIAISKLSAQRAQKKGIVQKKGKKEI